MEPNKNYQAFFYISVNLLYALQVTSNVIINVIANDNNYYKWIVKTVIDDDDDDDFKIKYL